MPGKKTRDILSHLGPAEGAHVLSELLRRHTSLRKEAYDIAKDLLDNISVEAVADEVADLVTAIGLEELGSRAGKHSWGYVEPGEAAWELLEESIENLRNDMKRRFEVGMEQGAEEICQGIILGLYSVRNTNSDGAHDWAPDFPAEAAARAASTLVELYPPHPQASGRQAHPLGRGRECRGLGRDAPPGGSCGDFGLAA